MTGQTQKRQSKYQLTDKNSVFFKLFLAYDIFMVFIIVFNLFCLGMNLFLMSYLGEWFFQNIHLPELLSFYRTHLHPWVVTTEAYRAFQILQRYESNASGLVIIRLSGVFRNKLFARKNRPFLQCVRRGYKAVICLPCDKGFEIVKP